MDAREQIKARLTKAMYSLGREIASTGDIGKGEIIVHIAWDGDEIVAFEEGEQRPPKAVKPMPEYDRNQVGYGSEEYTITQEDVSNSLKDVDRNRASNQYPKEFDDQEPDFSVGGIGDSHKD